MSNRSVDEAAPLLGVTPRTLRTYLARPEYVEKTVKETRQTRSGLKTATMLPPDLFSELSALFAEKRGSISQKEPENERGSELGSIAEDSEQSEDVVGDRSAPDAQPAAAARRVQNAPGSAELLAAKDAVIAALEGRIAASEAEISYLRDSLGKALELAHREQSLGMERVRALMLEATADGKKNGAGNGAGPGRVRAKMRLAFNGR